MGKSEVLRSRFGDRVKALLGEIGSTAGDLAERTALPVGRVEGILRGTLITITIDDMSIIADVLGTPLFTLLAPIELATSVVSLEEVEEGGPRHP